MAGNCQRTIFLPPSKKAYTQGCSVLSAFLRSLSDDASDLGMLKQAVLKGKANNVFVWQFRKLVEAAWATLTSPSLSEKTYSSVSPLMVYTIRTQTSREQCTQVLKKPKVNDKSHWNRLNLHYFSQWAISFIRILVFCLISVIISRFL